MMKILLNLPEGLKDYYAIVDDEDYEKVSSRIWTAKVQRANNIYAHTWFSKSRDEIKKFVLMHRFIMGLLNEDSKNINIDHINGNGLDNRKSNLRMVTTRQNNINKRKDSHWRGAPCHSKYKGVTWSKKREMWTAHIGHQDKLLFLGAIEQEVDGAYLYNKAALMLNGEYALLNELPEYYEPSEEIEAFFAKRWENIGKRTSGENNGMAKLSTESVICIYKAGKTNALTTIELANRFNVSRATINMILSGKRWSSVTKDISI